MKCVSTCSALNVLYSVIKIKENTMTFEAMILILAGKSAQVVKATEKALKPFVTDTKIYRQK